MGLRDCQLRVPALTLALSITTSVSGLSFCCHRYRGGVTYHVDVDEWVPVADSEVVSTYGSVGFRISVGKIKSPLLSCSATGRTAVLHPMPFMCRCVSHNCPEGGKLCLTDEILTQVSLWFCPSPCRQEQSVLEWTVPSASPLSMSGLWNRAGCVETCLWLVAGCGTATEKPGLIITIQVKALPCV